MENPEASKEKQPTGVEKKAEPKRRGRGKKKPQHEGPIIEKREGTFVISFD